MTIMSDTTNIQMRSLSGDELYPTTTMDNVIGLNDTLTNMNTSLETEMKTLDEQVKEELSTKIVNAHNDLLPGKNIQIEGYTAWKNKSGVTYFTSDTQTKSTLTNLTIYKNVDSNLIVVEDAYGAIVEATKCDCGCDCSTYYGTYVLQITGTITGVFFKATLEQKKVISATDTTYTNGNGLNLSETNVFSVNPFNGITVNENGVSVKVKETNSGLELDEEGLNVKVNDSLLVDENGIKVDAGYGLKIDDGSFKEEEKGKLEVDTDVVADRERFESFVVDMINNGVVSADLGTSDGLNIMSTNDENQFIMMSKNFNDKDYNAGVKLFDLILDKDTFKLKGRLILNNNTVIYSNEIDLPIENAVFTN